MSPTLRTMVVLLTALAATPSAQARNPQAAQKRVLQRQQAREGFGSRTPDPVPESRARSFSNWVSRSPSARTAFVTAYRAQLADGIKAPQAVAAAKTAVVKQLLERQAAAAAGDWNKKTPKQRWAINSSQNPQAIPPNILAQFMAPQRAQIRRLQRRHVELLKQERDQPDKIEAYLTEIDAVGPYYLHTDADRMRGLQNYWRATLYGLGTKPKEHGEIQQSDLTRYMDQDALGRFLDNGRW